MKTSFKKSVAVLLVALMLLSAFSVSVFAATTYSVSYKPGTYAKETDEYVQDGIEKNETITLLGETYTRTGYTHTGWSTNKNGTSRTYTLEKSQKITKNLTLYPYWTVNKYTITFDGGEFGVGTAQTKEVNHGKDTTAPAAIFTRDGYVQIGWTATVIEITEGPNGEEIFTPVVDDVALGGRIAKVTGDVTYVPVWEKLTIDSDYEISNTKFGSVCEDYAAPAAETLVITNAGNATLKYTLPTTAAYNITVMSGSLNLAPEASVTISVQPKAGLPVGNYSEALVFACDYADCSVTFEAKFTVNAHSFDKYVSNGDATYDADGTKTAECTNGCGATDTIADEGSMKIFSADNNKAIGLLPEYTYHKTVRFTAFGSGMDNENPVAGSKRFRPVSWWVNDEHNGELTEATGYDVNYVHTDFGSFGLVITYVEEVYTCDNHGDPIFLCEDCGELTGETCEYCGAAAQAIVCDLCGDPTCQNPLYEDDKTFGWVETGETDEKVFSYSIGASEKDQQEVVMPNTIVSIIFGLFTYFFEIIGSLFG